ITVLHCVFRRGNETLVSLQDSAANDCIRFAIPQPTEWQRVGNQIDAAMILARSDFVNVFELSHRFVLLYHFFCVATRRAKTAESMPMRHWLRIADNLRNAGFSWGCSCESDSTGRVLLPQTLTPPM